MANGESDFVFGLKDCPTMGGRAICERCWNNYHCNGAFNQCNCLCCEPVAIPKRSKREPKDVGFPANIGTITIKGGGDE